MIEMLKMKMMLATVLSVSAIGLATASSTSASGFVVWGAEWCTLVRSGSGGFGNQFCNYPVNGGSYSRAITWGNGLAFYCLWIGGGFGMLGDAGCIYLSLGGGYGVFADPPALAVSVKGGAYKIKGTIAKVKVTIACSSMQAVEPELESDGHSGSAAMLDATSLEYKGCKTEEPSKCEVNSPSKSAGVLSTPAILAHLVENTAKTKVENLLKPKSGTVFSEFEFTGECTLKGTKATIEGSTLTGGGAEDEIGNELKFEDTVKTGDVYLLEKSVEKYLLISEPTSKGYLNDETGATEEAKLTVSKEPITLTGEASLLGKTSAVTVKDEETGEEVGVPEGTADIGLERE
jgi:hypothetical protein